MAKGLGFFLSIFFGWGRGLRCCGVWVGRSGVDHF